MSTDIPQAVTTNKSYNVTVSNNSVKEKLIDSSADTDAIDTLAVVDGSDINSDPSSAPSSSTTSNACINCLQNSFIADYLKAVIYGGLDGIITTFAIVAGIQGANLSAGVILALGFGHLLADSLSMGAGDYLSEKAEMDVTQKQCRELSLKLNHSQRRRGLLRALERKLEELFEPEESKNFVGIVEKNEGFLIKQLITLVDGEEYKEGTNADAMKSGLVTMLSFILFGFVPLISYVIYHIVGESYKESSETTVFVICIFMTVGTMLLLGAMKGALADGKVFRSALFVAGNGSIAAALAYVVSWAISQLIGVTSCE